MTSSSVDGPLLDMLSVAVIHEHPATLLLIKAKLVRAPRPWGHSGFIQHTLLRVHLVPEELGRAWEEGRREDRG